MVPASMCCIGAPLIEGHDCSYCCSAPDQDHDSPGHEEACPSDTISRSQMPAPLITPVMQMTELVAIIHTWIHLPELVSQEEAPLPWKTTAPPELWKTWVFMSRSALPARAPSVLA
jgi:hypothetical protein